MLCCVSKPSQAEQAQLDAKWVLSVDLPLKFIKVFQRSAATDQRSDFPVTLQCPDGAKIVQLLTKVRCSQQWVSL